MPVEYFTPGYFGPIYTTPPPLVVGSSTGYTHTTFSTLIAQLAARLQDSGFVYWSSVELGRYINEALQMWAVASLYFREQGQLYTAPDTPFYDPEDVTNGTGAFILERTATDRETVNSIQYHLLEAVNDFSSSATWAGSEMFTMDDVVKAVQRRRDQFLLETGQILTVSELVAAGGTIALPDNMVDIERVAWETFVGGIKTDTVPLQEMDEFQLGNLSPTWTADPGTPLSYSIAAIPTLKLRLAPAPNNPGRVHLITINSGATLNVATGVALGVMNDFAQFIKWGALADLLGKDGQARDPERAKYCEQRWKEGLELARIHTTVLSGEILGQPATISSVFHLDAAFPSWQVSSGPPEIMATEGENLLAFYKVPDNVYGVVLDVVRNAPLLSAAGDYVQVGREHLDIILDYAQHLACFKMGGTEFRNTVAHYQRLLEAAAGFNGRLKAHAAYFDSMHTSPLLEEERRPNYNDDGQ